MSHNKHLSTVLVWYTHFNKIFDHNSKHYQHNYMYVQNTHAKQNTHSIVDSASDKKYKSVAQ